LTAVNASLLFASFDLAVNLKFPNLQWTNEMVAVKQSISVVVAMFGGWGISLLPLGGYFLFGKYMPAWGYVILCLGLFTAITAALIVWLYKKGVKIFKSLSV
jgi:ABC-2 type transport system permease protein